MPVNRLTEGDRVLDRRTGQWGKFQRWQRLMGRLHALAISGKRRWWIPQEHVHKPLTADALYRKKRRQQQENQAQ